MKFQVYVVEQSYTKSGKSLKRMVLQGEGKQYPDKGVTMWEDHPLFNEVAPGQTIDVELDVKDSDKPNPNAPGTFYKNKTVINPNRAAGVRNAPVAAAIPQASTSDSRIMNALTLKVIPLLENIRKDQMAILEKMKMRAPYPEMTPENDAHDLDYIPSEVSKSDFPF